ncbi:hypothetical protein VaNZ11_003625 [Volvox africanus]|uniref:SGNH hydrolase-type esterase domain-containing protein n=1 Tax=Volvox africanus TaxID=51714 RepID=A0ABQ5RVF0_9CHLO|nr:hypothetical protein VaNZ11_003625 [Volvox africanus]
MQNRQSVHPLFVMLIFSLSLLFLSVFSSASLDGPRLENLTETEIKYAHIYYNYNIFDHILPASDGIGSPGGYKFFIPAPERMAGITYVGHAARFRMVLERARKGERLRIGALGGSITAGQGVGGAKFTYLQRFIDWLNFVMPPHDDKSGSPTSQQAAFQTQDTNVAVGLPRQHDFINGAVSGTESGYSSSCLHHHLIPGADLVFVDYAMNDLPTASWPQAGPSRRAMERLVRKVLNLPSRPAVVLVNMFAMGPSHGKYWYTAERDFMEFATYYSLPAVSLKAAVLPSVYAGGPEKLSLGAIFNGGLNHPGRGGHVVVFEVLVTLAMDLLRSNPRYLLESRTNTTETAAAGDATSLAEDGAAALLEVWNRPLPPPMAANNYESSRQTCYIEDELLALTQPPVEGWEWTDEGRGKWGYVAMAPGKTLRLKFDTRLMGNRTDEDRFANIIVQIAFLQSYTRMRTARVDCTEGCQCSSVTIDAYSARQVSLTSMKDIKVTQHSACIMAITSGPQSHAATVGAATANVDAVGRGGGDEMFKFKLMGVVVGEEPGASAGTVTSVRGDSHVLWKRTRDAAGAQHY